MDIWEKFEALPPVQRILIVFSVTALLIVAVYLVYRRAAKRRIAGPEGFSGTALVEKRADSTLVAYIAFWRYVIFGLFFAAGFVMCFCILVRLWDELPQGFWRHWDTAYVPAIVLVIAVAMPLFSYGILKGGYKKVQLEISKYSVRYIQKAIRGGIMLSESYVSVSLKDITGVALRSNLFGGGVIEVNTSAQQHSILLLLSREELELCLGALQQAMDRARIDRSQK